METVEVQIERRTGNRKGEARKLRRERAGLCIGANRATGNRAEKKTDR